MSRLELEYVPVKDLRTFHRNPRQGNTGMIAQSLRINGQYKPIVINRGTHTGRPNEVLAGNHTLMAARDEAWEEIAGVWVDVDDDQAGRIVAADNRIGDLGSYDERLLAELLGDLPDLDGTGYEPGDLEELERALAEPEFEPDGDVERLDQKHKTKCPECGHVFTPTTYKAWRDEVADAG